MGLGIVAAGLGGDEAATVGRLCLLLARDALHPVPCQEHQGAVGE